MRRSTSCIAWQPREDPLRNKRHVLATTTSSESHTLAKSEHLEHGHMANPPGSARILGLQVVKTCRGQGGCTDLSADVHVETL